MPVDPYIHVNVRIPSNIGIKSIQTDRSGPDASQISIGYSSDDVIITDNFVQPQGKQNYPFKNPAGFAAKPNGFIVSVAGIWLWNNVPEIFTGTLLNYFLDRAEVAFLLKTNINTVVTLYFDKNIGTAEVPDALKGKNF
jgi:hypothetical protein